MKVAAYQSRISYGDPSDALMLLRTQVDQCEALGVEVLCCAEGLLGGLADYVDQPSRIAIRVRDGELARLLALLASDTVTTILGFTEAGDDGRLYNSAAVWSRGAVLGVYRKRHPAINRSLYHAGADLPVFSIGAFTFGIMICRDSAFPDVAKALVSGGARALFVPTNNGMPEAKGGANLVAEARRGDIDCATEHGVPVIRADVTGRTGQLVSYGATGIVDCHGKIVGEAPAMLDALVLADLELSPHAPV